ncbi:threonine synthase-like 2 isoform X2 [Syngnathoides biaculeatus]|uniref:threonine synthase-like 2 isoform X2 n=1 Tax=Syngnathoides biaculeatus TaxID=300417 RepID=UPI002ADDED50|nr:threonine synthase-like 2 isoform X2 [Syngnathoides biaculeatus]
MTPNKFVDWPPIKSLNVADHSILFSRSSKVKRPSGKYHRSDILREGCVIFQSGRGLTARISCWRRKFKGGVTCLSVGVRIPADGSSDDIDQPLRHLFADQELVKYHGLMSLNSVNWSRIMIQLTHFIYAYLELSGMTQSEDHKPLPQLEVVVPTGGAGNIAAGFIVKQMGLPLKLVAMVNANDIVHRGVTFGDFTMAAIVTQTLAPAIDIQMPFLTQPFCIYSERELKPIPPNFGQRQTTRRTGHQPVAVQMSTPSLSGNRSHAAFTQNVPLRQTRTTTWLTRKMSLTSLHYTIKKKKQDPYNMERIFWLLLERDSALVKNMMEEFQHFHKHILLENHHKLLSRTLSTGTVTDEGILETMRRCWEENQYVLCPHTAVAAWHHYHCPHNPAVKRCYLATASPAKFQATIERAGLIFELPEAVKALDMLPSRYQNLERTLDWCNDWEQRLRMTLQSVSLARKNRVAYYN